MAVDTKLSSQVELFISCNDLPKMDRLSRSDPFGVVSWIQPNGTRTEIGRTETIYDTHDPQFTTQLRVEYFFEQNQKLRFDIYDEDKKGSHNLSDHDFIGYCEMQLSEVGTLFIRTHVLCYIVVLCVCRFWPRLAVHCDAV
ncbi:MAG: hypothetical protein MHM6MM_009376 [Cercozoa sp. M6MM]